MKRIPIGRRSAIAGVVTVAVLALAAGIAYATIPDDGKVFTACMLKNVGTIRLIDKSLPPANVLSHCTNLETEISWNQVGQQGTPGLPGAKGEPGKDGASVMLAAEPAGTNCANGGVKLMAGNASAYVCNGKDGRDGVNGKDGTNGTNGQDGAPGPKGDPGLAFRGEWSPFADYVIGSVVTHNGSSWVNPQYGCCGAEPGASDTWQLLAAKGADGTNGVSGYEFVTRSVNIASGPGSLGIIVTCPQGKMPVSGGVDNHGLTMTASTLSSIQFDVQPDGSVVRTGSWLVGVGNPTGQTVAAQFNAICMKATP